MSLVVNRSVFGDESLGKVSWIAHWWTAVDRVTLFSVVALCLIGLLLGMASSAGLAERHNLGEFYFVQKQAFFSGLSVAVMVVMSMLPEKVLRVFCLTGMCMVLTLLCLLPSFGTDFGKGAIRWFSVGGMSFQPSEFFKPFFAVGAGGMLSMISNPKRFGGVHCSILLVLTVVMILALQPDYGQAALILSSWFLMYLVSGSSLVGLIGIGAVMCVGSVFAYSNSDHVARRIDSFLSQSVDPNEQIGYSIQAIESGGMFGAGIGEGSVKFALPDAHTDFIIAVAAEEYGFVMVLTIVSLYLVIIIRSFIRAMVEPRHDKRVISCGLAGLLGMQALINIGVSVKFFPAKGMTLPFVSYGGSSALAVGMTAGLLLAFTKFSKDQTNS